MPVQQFRRNASDTRLSLTRRSSVATTGKAFALAAAAALMTVDAATAAEASCAPETQASAAPVLGDIRFGRSLSLASTLRARVKRVAVAPGDRIAQGDVLVELDCGVEDARIEELHANLGAARQRYENERELYEHGAQGKLAVNEAKFALAAAEAKLKGATAKRSECVLEAPFDGVVASSDINPMEIASPHVRLMQIVDPASKEVVFDAPLDWIAWVRPGAPIGFELASTPGTYALEIDRIEPIVAARATKVRVVAKFTDNESAPAVAGLRGQARVMLAGYGETAPSGACAVPKAAPAKPGLILTSATRT